MEQTQEAQKNMLIFKSLAKVKENQQRLKDRMKEARSGSRVQSKLHSSRASARVGSKHHKTQTQPVVFESKRSSQLPVQEEKEQRVKEVKRP